MNPEPNQHIKIFFRNGLIEEGIVIFWSDAKSVLRAVSGMNLLIIQNTSADVQAVKIFVEESEGRPMPIQEVYIDEELKTSERDPSMRAMKLAELRILRGREERERARKAMTTFDLSKSASGTEYGLPRRLQKPPDFGAIKKNRTRNS